MKKLISVLLFAAILLSTVSCGTVFAEGTPNTIQLNSVSVQQGKTAEMTLSLENNTGIAGLIVTLKYDTAVLTLTNAQNGAVFDSLSVSKNLVWSTDSGENATGNGVLATLTFAVSEDAQRTEYPIEILLRECTDQKLSDVDCTVEDGAITVTCGHKNVSEVKGSAPGCITAGLTAGFRCDTCGDWTVPPEEIPPTGHAYGAWTRLNDTQHQRVCANDASHVETEDHVWNGGKITTAATCKIEGVKTYTCTVCGGTKTEPIPKLTEHTWNAGKETTPATCKNAGVKTFTCTVCGITKTEPIPKTDKHTWDNGEITAPATCKGAGVKTFTCTVCGVTKTEPIPKTDAHTPGEAVKENVVAASCKAEGSYDEAVYCTVCKNELSRERKKTEKLPHTPEVLPAVAATCTQTGLTEGKKCSVCGEILTAQEEIPALGHNYGAWTKLDDNQHQRVCANNASHTEKEDHKWDAGKVTTPATETEAGVKTFTCSVCGAEKTETIDPIPHTDQDRKTGISVTYGTDAFSGTVTLNVEKIDNAAPALPAKFTSTTTYDISFEMNGEKIQPKTTVTVRIPIPEGYKVSSLKVYHITASGTAEEVRIRIENGEIVFTASSFSQYVIVDTSTEVETPAFTPGDVNGDGKVTAADARFALRRAVGLETYEPGSVKFLACDVDGNGKVTASDARKILRAAVGLETLK